jgi:hypothetical protein
MKHHNVYKKYWFMELSDFIADSAYGFNRTCRIASYTFHWPFPIASSLNSSGAMILGYLVHGNDPSKFIDIVFSILRRVNKIILYFMIKHVYKYHVITPRHLRPKYYVYDYLLLHASMEIMERYVEEEVDSDLHGYKFDNQGHLLFENGGIRSEADTVFCTIYNWWKFDHPADLENLNNLYRLSHSSEPMETKEVVMGNGMIFTEILPGKMSSLDTEIEFCRKKIKDNENKMLKSLMEYRDHMWV